MAKQTPDTTPPTEEPKVEKTTEEPKVGPRVVTQGTMTIRHN